MAMLLFLHSYSTIRLFVCVIFCISTSVDSLWVSYIIGMLDVLYICILYILYQNLYQIGTERYTHTSAIYIHYQHHNGMLPQSQHV